MNETVIILGANGQIGTELAIALRARYGAKNVITTDIREPDHLTEDTIFHKQDILDKEALEALFEQYKPTQIYILAAMLSATAEKYPEKAWDLNMTGLLNVLNLCVEKGIKRVFWPSSIAAFGINSPRVDTPQYCTMDPGSIYGISKLAGERLCEYYHHRYGLDIRSIRYPGLISWKAVPGGGTTDYAIHIYFEALENGQYECFLSAETELPMLYMDDAVRATIQLMDAPAENLRIRSSYNLGGLSFTPEDIAKDIKRVIPEFEISYVDNDPRQSIADSWPKSIDDTYAQEDWGWKPEFALSDITDTMLAAIQKK